MPDSDPWARPTLADFRAALRRFGTGVTVVTTQDAGVDHAMTANSFASVSLDPLLVLVCVEKATRFHDAVLASGRWGVSVLREDARDAAVWFATRGRPLAGQLDRVPHRRGPATGSALLEAAVSTLECQTWATTDGGDHTVVLGEVLAARTLTDRAPLLYLDGRYTVPGAPTG